MSTDDPAGVESTGTTTAESPAHQAATSDWNGPFLEVDAYGNLTGYQYVRCPACGIEVLAASRRHATHHPECPHR
jgi:DNA-directed RNA polymerase subunit RPC12/RpoP